MEWLSIQEVVCLICSWGPVQDLGIVIQSLFALEGEEESPPSALTQQPPLVEYLLLLYALPVANESPLPGTGSPCFVNQVLINIDLAVPQRQVEDLQRQYASMVVPLASRPRGG